MIFTCCFKRKALRSSGGTGRGGDGCCQGTGAGKLQENYCLEAPVTLHCIDIHSCSWETTQAFPCVESMNGLNPKLLSHWWNSTYACGRRLPLVVQRVIFAGPISPFKLFVRFPWSSSEEIWHAQWVAAEGGKEEIPFYKPHSTCHVLNPIQFSRSYATLRLKR